MLYIVCIAMLIPALSVVLVALLIANVSIVVFNKMYPPCEKPTEYLKSARRISRSEHSLPKHKAVERDNSQLFNELNKIMKFDEPQQETSGTKKTRTSGNQSSIFEEEMEGLKSDNSHHSTRYERLATGSIKSVERDGYASRKVNEW